MPTSLTSTSRPLGWTDTRPSPQIPVLTSLVLLGAVDLMQLFVKGVPAGWRLMELMGLERHSPYRWNVQVFTCGHELYVNIMLFMDASSSTTNEDNTNSEKWIQPLDCCLSAELRFSSKSNRPVVSYSLKDAVNVKYSNSPTEMCWMTIWLCGSGLLTPGANYKTHSSERKLANVNVTYICKLHLRT